MFRKLLKYDNRAILKYWWIGVLITLGISIVGGLCIQVLASTKAMVLYEFLYTLAMIGLIFSIFGLMLLPFLTEILILVRYYKHFFSDEGYLTFTLPVKVSTLLDSKLAMTLIFMVSSTLIFLLEIFIMLAVGIPEHVFSAETWSVISNIFSQYFAGTGVGYGIFYIVIIIMILIASVAAQMLFIFLCITLAAIITRKHKVLVAIGIYYGANMVLSFVVQMLTYGGSFAIVQFIIGLDQTTLLAAIALIAVGLLGIMIIAAAGLYQAVLYMLDKRLNLE